MHLLSTALLEPEDEIDNNSGQQRNSQHRRPKPVVETALPASPNTLRSPVKRHQCIYHRSHCHECEQRGTNLAYAVAKVKQANSQAAEDDREVEP